MTSRALLEVLFLLLFLLGALNDINAITSEEESTLFSKYLTIHAIQNGYDKVNVKSDFKVKHGKVKLDQMISEQKRNVICGLKYIALSYMRISKNLFLWYGKDQLDSAVGQIESFNEHALNMITVLYNIGYQDTMFSMWYFYIYSCKIGHFRARIDKNKQNDAKLTTIELADIHENVIAKLSQHKKMCKDTKHNIASTSHTLHKKYKYLSIGNASHKEIIAVIDAYKGTVSDLINYNKKLQYGSKNASRLTIDSLHLNGVVLNEEIMNELLNFYDSNIIWGDAADVLKKTYNNLFDSPSIMFDNFREIQSFQMLFKNILLTIVLRFAWSHLVISDHCKDTMKIFPFFLFPKKFDHENNEFINVLEPFLQFLDLHNQPGLNDLLYCLRLSLKDRALLCLGVIMKELTTIGKHFNDFDPMGGIISNKHDLSIHFDKLVTFARKNGLLTKYRSKPIKGYTMLKKNHTRLFIFINRVRQILKNADFEFMYTLLSYTSFTNLDKLKSNDEYKYEVSEDTSKNDGAKLIEDKIEETIETVSNIGEENDNDDILFEKFKIKKKQAEDQSEGKSDDNKTGVAEDKKKPECDPSTYGPNEDDDTNIPSSVWHPQKDGPNLLRTWIELDDKNDILSSIFGTTAYKNDSDKSSEAEELQQDNVKEKQIGEETTEDKKVYSREETPEDKKAETEQAPEEIQAPTLQPRSLEYEIYPDELDLANLSGGAWEIPKYLLSLSEYNAIVDESPSKTE